MDIFDKAKRSQIMARVRSADTAPERRVRSILHRMGFRFQLHRKDLPGTPDIVLPGHKRVVLVHGCFWHRHKGCPDASMPKTRGEFWEKKFSENAARDKKNVRTLKNLGWKCLIVWECEIREDVALERKLSTFLRLCR